MTSVGGLHHLEGETVVALANGSVITGLTVSGGSVTLSRAASRIHVGLPYEADAETLNLEPKAFETTQGKRKKIPSVTFRVEDTRGISAGPDVTRLTRVKACLTEMLTDDVPVILKPSWNSRGRLHIRQPHPLPMTILAAIPEIVTGDS